MKVVVELSYIDIIMDVDVSYVSKGDLMDC